jgi:L-2-hydroxyglutarate oxidase LhgO
VLSENREAGDLEAELLSARTLHEREPCLAGDAMGAVWCPREAVVEPWLLPHGYAESASLCGAHLLLSTEAVSATYDRNARLWRVLTQPSTAAQCGRSPPGELLVLPPADAAAATEPCIPTELHARVVINCAGLYGDVVHQWAPVSIGGTGVCSGSSSNSGSGSNSNSGSGSDSGSGSGSNSGSGSGSGANARSGFGGETADNSLPPTRKRGMAEMRATPMEDPSVRVADSAPFHVMPRKGQFVVLQPAPHTCLPAAVLEQVASQFTKGVIVWQTLYGNVVIGPTAEPQASRADRTTSEEAVRALLAHGERCVPALRGATLLGSYSGLRPATEHRDYQISWTSCDGPAKSCDVPGTNCDGPAESCHGSCSRCESPRTSCDGPAKSSDGPEIKCDSLGTSGNGRPTSRDGSGTNCEGAPKGCGAPVVGVPGAGGSGWISVAGIRSTGLSCAPGIGEYVAELYIGLRDGTPPVHASASRAVDDGLSGASSCLGGSGRGHLPFPDGCAVGVTEAALMPVPLEPAPERLNGPVPSLAELAAEYRRRGDGRVTLYGRLRRVTHPVTSFGLQSICVHGQGG